MNSYSAIEMNDLAVGYKNNLIAEHISLGLNRGEVTALLGKNGSGKSTLIKTMTGTLKPLGGNVKVDGKDLKEISRKELARQIALVSTDADFAGGLTVKEVVSLGRYPYTGLLSRLSEEDRQIIENAIDAVGISHKAESFLAELSDGERQKAMVARALAQTPSILIMDEPFSFLDVEGRIELLSFIISIAREKNTAVLYSTHDVSQSLRMADRIWMFEDDCQLGKRIISGSPAEIIEKGHIHKLFKSDKIEFDADAKDFIAKT